MFDCKITIISLGSARTVRQPEGWRTASGVVTAGHKAASGNYLHEQKASGWTPQSLRVCRSPAYSLSSEPSGRAAVVARTVAGWDRYFRCSGEEPFNNGLEGASSSDVDAEFDAVVGHIEDIIMGEEFQVLQRHFMDKYYLEFENTEENKLSYTSIFQEYVDLLEKYIERQLIERIPAFDMTTFITSLQQHKDEISGDIFDMLLTFTDFLAFKEMFLDYRMEKEGHGLDFSGDLIVTPLSKSSSLSPASNNILPLQ
ncbi:ADP-ribosylation factor-like protein 2-binding protein isoform X3 [Mobula birostris]|uniref:ADP-ribosylation factor-like protein 2-binding protein isoform X3 n=1 Tax=Mobula birostris TaxID=1983395 RepID=UPI003B286712